MNLSPQYMRRLLDGLHIILRSPFLSMDATDKAFEDNKISSFNKINNFLMSFFNKITSTMWFMHFLVKRFGWQVSINCYIIEFLYC